MFEAFNHACLECFLSGQIRSQITFIAKGGTAAARRIASDAAMPPGALMGAVVVVVLRQ